MKITVIGGGIAGVCSALELSKLGHEVILLESNENLLNGSSNNTPCRVGIGLHYIDKITAVKYLKNTIAFLKKYKDFLLDLPEDLSGSDYVVVKDSVFDYIDIADVHTTIINEYRNLIEEDEENKILGEPRDLIKFGVEKPRYINENKIRLTLKTAEQILDWKSLKEKLIDDVLANSNITVINNAEVMAIEHNLDIDINAEQMKIRLNDGEEYTSDMVVNCSWHNTEKLNQTFSMEYSRDRTCRLKAMAEIKLPENMQDIRTTFFCFGPHCAITNVGNGIAYITYEPVTNMEQTSDISITEEMDFWLNNGTDLNISEEGLSIEDEYKERRLQKYELGKNIIAGVSEYVEGIENAELLNVSFGIVKTPGNQVSIESKDSPHHKRSESGIRNESLGLITNQSMKLLYGASNALEICDVIENNEWILTSLKDILQGQEDISPIKRKALFSYIDRYNAGFFGDERIGAEESINNLVAIKELTNQVLKNR